MTFTVKGKIDESRRICFKRKITGMRIETAWGAGEDTTHGGSFGSGACRFSDGTFMLLNTVGSNYILRISHVHGHHCGYFLQTNIKEREGSTVQSIKGSCLLSEPLTSLDRSEEKGPHIINIM